MTTVRQRADVTPLQAGIHLAGVRNIDTWVPAFAGTTA
jgi:hypothetical protein